MVIQLLAIFFLLLSYYFIFSSSKKKSKFQTSSSHSPKSYPLIGSTIDIAANKDRRVQWTSDILRRTPTSTFTLDHAFGSRRVYTADPANVQHILKSHFPNYQKGFDFRTTLFDLLGNGIFNADGDTWKLQRQLSSHEFNTRSLRKFVETVVDSELTNRLIPTLSSAVATGAVLDLQDVLQRFTFDNICVIAFGYDPAYLAPSLPEARFAVAFEDAVRIISERFNSPVPQIWRIKKFLGIGSEYQLRQLVSEVRDFAKKVIQEKKKQSKNKPDDSVDLLSRFLNPAGDNYDDDFIVDIVISFILAGRDTTSAALTWFFWLLWKNPEAESKILEEIGEKSELPIYEEVKDMVYTHASLCEAMRLYPPVPVDTKVAASDDVLPDGTAVKKGTRVSYHPYAMGRMEEIWGPDWAEFKPERWLEKKDEEEGGGEKWSFVGRDPYSYPVFQAGPRICLGKEMAFLQMKRVVAGILRRFKVVPAAKDREEPVLISYLTTKMKDGFPVRFQERDVSMDL
ncbi:Cytochrome P450 94A1 [Linum perenne]